MEISGGDKKELLRPNIKLVANIHGAEAVGREMSLRFIQVCAILYVMYVHTTFNVRYGYIIQFYTIWVSVFRQLFQKQCYLMPSIIINHSRRILKINGTKPLINYCKRMLESFVSSTNHIPAFLKHFLTIILLHTIAHWSHYCKLNYSFSLTFGLNDVSFSQVSYTSFVSFS